jgi:hypothetical protein
LTLKTYCRILAALLMAAFLPLHAQHASVNRQIDGPLPDAPQPRISSGSTTEWSQQPGQSLRNPSSHYAPRLARYIQPDQLTRRLSSKEKLELGVHEQIRPYALTTQLMAAGWEQLINSNPKYGTDSAAFGERLGAASIRQNSNALLSDGVFPALFHQDPRYYRLGSGKIGHRILYSASRILVTRTDSGDPAPNYSRFAGAAAVYAMTMTYYPAVSATWPKTARSYGVSLLTGALGNELHEFVPDLIHLVRHRHQDERTAGTANP